ncbi:MAG: MarR family winged helix-turn-helix transcriptional regulator [Methyloligellaceae bacterium]
MERKSESEQRELNHSAIHLLHRAGQCAGDLFTEEVIHEGLTPRQYAVLLTVSRNEGLSQTELVARTGIDRSTLADIIRRMLNKGLISRRRTRKDARVYSVTLTNEGRMALRAAEPAAVQADARLLAALPPAEREQFLDSLAAIVRTMCSANGKNGA